MVSTLLKASAFSLLICANMFARDNGAIAADQTVIASWTVASDHKIANQTAAIGQPIILAQAQTAAGETAAIDAQSTASETTANQPTTRTDANATQSDRSQALGEAERLDEIVVTAQTGGGGANPSPTHSITDSLRSDSSIQFSKNSRSSATGGEIAPPRVSIRGSQHYENNFMINEVSNNNNLNPSGLDVSTWENMSGEAQSLFIDTSLVESVETHTENISAEYGGFTGGVINAKLKDARTDRWHIMAKYRYTKDDWAKFHLADDQKLIDKSTSVNYQPEFNKYEYAVALDGPINDYLGAMISYGRQHSKIPLWSEYDINGTAGATYKERRTQYRDNKNYLAKLNTRNIDGFEASLTAIYAPYTAAMYFPEARNSDFDQKGGGLNIAYDMKNILSFGALKNTLAYKKDEYSANGDGNYYYMWANAPGYANWYHGGGYGSREGYTGDQAFLGDAVIYKGIIDFNKIETDSLTHLIKTGVEAEFGKARYKRDEAYYYCCGTLDSGVSGSKEEGIISGEQWADILYRYDEIDHKKSYATAALFLEDSIGIDRFTVRPGVRFSTDTITDNTNIAPRFFVNVDAFNNKVVNIYGGYNRYYDALLLFNAVYMPSYTVYTRTTVNDPWIAGSPWPGWGGKYYYTMDGVKTPYADEFSAGAALHKWDALFKLDFVKRAYRDQLKQEQKTIDTDIYEVRNNNDGKTDYWGVTLSASKEYELGATKHFSEISVTTSDSSNNLNGMNSFSAVNEHSNTHITYDGELRKYEDVPSPDYNAPVIIAYSHIMELGDYLNLGLNARYEKGVDGFRWISDGGLTDPDGRNTKEYETKHYGDIFTVDLSVNYTLKLNENKLTFGLEVLNLLNRKNDAGYAESYNNVEGYAMGRQFYANVKYEY
ncbi:MAG: TonB-dependent receptor plug domain-containing protein [Helicobacteraceae bacterium]|nr:TonB-dependent receptor plug domain-containing protein [Helicobacteraceae bacterium]